jgi:hypothetical protein
LVECCGVIVSAAEPVVPAAHGIQHSIDSNTLNIELLLGDLELGAGQTSISIPPSWN